MINSIVENIDVKILPKEGWLRTCILTCAAGSGILFCMKYMLSLKYGYCKNNILLTGKTCIVTGGNTGIGKAVAMELARRKAYIILACRDLQKANDAAIEIRKYYTNAQVKVYQLDLSSFASVRHFVDEIKQNERKIDILINNAGVMSCPFNKSTDGFEMQFAVNHLGHFLLTNLLLSEMEIGDSRIIVLSSALYKHATLDLINYNEESGYDPMSAYAKSKLANLLFTHQLAKRLPEGITINAMHPGIVSTDLGRHRLTNVLLKTLFSFVAYFLMRTPFQGSQTIIHMATDPSLKGVTGQYFGNCKIEQVNQFAKDEKISEKLWELSTRLTKLDD